MTTDNTEVMVECEDGETRPLSLCVQTHDNRWIATEDSVTLHDGTVCDSECDDICYVERHGEWYWLDDCTVVNDEWELDRDCRTCQCCGDGVLRFEAYDSPDCRPLCEDCYNSEVTSCSDCGTEVWCSECNFNEDGQCEDCAPVSSIRCYSDKSANHLRSEYRGPLKAGIELEVEGYESDEQAAEYIRTLLPENYCTLKRDGSLGENGVEIVTRPDGFAVHKRMWAAFFKDSPGKALSSWNTNRCGMHVHVSRSALSELQIGKMLCFLNEPAAVNFISKIAGRQPCHWCKVYKKKISDVNHEDDRYTALNVTGSRTVEFRIFKGTLAEAGFMKNLEFVQALVEFTAPACRSIAEATSYRAFCDWLPRKQYPYLFQFLVSKGFIRRRNAA